MLAACVQHTFAPGPGMSAADFEPDSARCRIFARSANPDFEFGAYGSPRFVATSMTAAAIGDGIAGAIRENQNYNDCMEARGWRVVDGSPQTGLAMPTGGSPPDASIPRHVFGVRADVVTAAEAAHLHLGPPRGVIILAVQAGGAAASAGLLAGDVILTFEGTPIMSRADIQSALDGVKPNSTAAATIWRSGRRRAVEIEF